MRMYAYSIKIINRKGKRIFFLLYKLLYIIYILLLYIIFFYYMLLFRINYIISILFSIFLG